MIQSYLNTITNLESNTSSIVFPFDDVRTRSCNCNGWLCHNQGSANYDIVQGGLYEITFDATITSGTVGAIAFALYSNGEMLPGTLMVETIATAGDYANIGIDKKIKVCCNADSNISIRAVPTVPTATDPTTPIATQVPIILSANFSVTRIC